MDERMKLFDVKNGIPQLFVGEGFFDDVSVVSSSSGVFLYGKCIIFPFHHPFQKLMQQP